MKNVAAFSLQVTATLVCTIACSANWSPQRLTPNPDEFQPQVSRSLVRGRIPIGAKLRIEAAHHSDIRCLDFSPDGRLLVTGALDFKTIVWDVASGSAVVAYYGERVSACAFVGDRHVAIGTLNGDALLWGIYGGDPTTVSGNSKLENSEVTALAGRAGKWELLIGRRDGGFRTATRAGGRWVQGSHRKLAGSVHSVGYGAAGRPYAAADELFYAGKTLAVKAGKLVAVLPTKRNQFVLGSSDGRISELDIEDGRTKHVKEGVRDPVLSARRDADIIAVVNTTRTLTLIARRSGQTICERQLEDDHLMTVKVHPTLPQVAVGTLVGGIKLLGTDCTTKLKIDPVEVIATKLAATNEQLMIGDSSGRVSAWDRVTLEQKFSIRPLRGGVNALTHLGGSRWAVGSRSGRVVVFDGQDFVASTTFGLPITELAQVRNGRLRVGLGRAGFIDWEFQRERRRDVKRCSKDTTMLAMSVDGKAFGCLRPAIDRIRLDLESGWQTFFGTTVRAVRLDSRSKRVIFATDFYGVGIARFGGYTSEKRLMDADGADITSLETSSDGFWLGRKEGELEGWRWTSETPFFQAKLSGAVNSIATTPDQQLLLADGLAGEVIVLDTKDLRRIATLRVLSGGNWIAITEAREFVASEQGAMWLGMTLGSRYSTLFEVATPAARPRLWVSDPHVERLNRNTVVVSADIDSPAGAPSIELDQVPIDALAIGSNSRKYRVSVQITDHSGGTHVFRVTDPTGTVRSLQFLVPPDLSASRKAKRHKVLAVGNEVYAGKNRRAHGAKTDAREVAKAFASSEVWAASTAVHKDLTGTELKASVRRFLLDADSSDILLVYFAGHGRRVGSEFFLLGTDEATGGELSARDLSSWVRASPAAAVLVVLDACRDGEAEGVEDALREAAAEFTTQAFVTATEPGVPAQGSASGGAFTTALLKVLGASKETLTLRTALRGVRVLGEDPRHYGGLRSLPLASGPGAPSHVGSSLTRTETADGGTEILGFEVVGTRQARVTSADQSGQSLIVRVRLDASATLIRLRVFAKSGAKTHTCQQLAYFDPSDPSVKWPKRTAGDLRIDLEKCRIPLGHYVAEVAPIRDGHADGAPRIEFEYQE